MPRNYIKKKTAGPSHQQEDVIRAVEDVPASVICRRLTWKRKTPIDCRERGRKKAISPEIEDVFEKCLIERARVGCPCDKEELQLLVKAYLENTNLRTLKGNKPSDDWNYGFFLSAIQDFLSKHQGIFRSFVRIIYSFYNTFQVIPVGFELLGKIDQL